MPTYSRYMLKGLVYIIIIALFSRQLSSYTKYTKLNIRLFYNTRLISNTEYIFFIYLTIL